MTKPQRCPKHPESEIFDFQGEATCFECELEADPSLQEPIDEIIAYADHVIRPKGRHLIICGTFKKKKEAKRLKKKLRQEEFDYKFIIIPVKVDGARDQWQVYKILK